MAIGRISGPLLKSNLIRDGVDLAFETDLLYLDVTNSRIGVNKSSPTTQLDVNGTTRTTTLVADNQVTVGTVTISGNSISTSANTISFIAAAGEATIYHSRLQIDDLQLTGNTISTTVSNSSLELRPNGTGTLNVVGNTNITGNLDVSGNIKADGNVVIGGNITIGDALTDNVVINASIRSDLVPETDNTYDIGSASYRWRSLYVNNFYTTSITLPTLNVGNITFNNNQISTNAGQSLYIDGNGSGGVRLGNFNIVDNVITNVSPNAITQIAQTSNGYFKIATTNGFVPPVGTNGERPTAYAVVGMTRYNTDSKALEIWDGAIWASPAGTSGAVSGQQAEDTAIRFALTLG